MAFTSHRTGRREVYVWPFPSGEGEWTISVAGGRAPRWRGNGNELFFVAADGDNKHGGGLNPAAIEASLWSRECHDRDRVDTFEALRRKIIWRITTAKARRVFRYRRRSTRSRSRH